MKTITEELIDEREQEKAFAVGVMRGTWAGAGMTATLLILGAIVPTVWRFAFHHKPISDQVSRAETQSQPFTAFTIYKNVPFIRLSTQAIQYGLNNPSTRKLIEREMVSRVYFEAELLRGRTQYIPKLRDPSNVHSPITLSNGPMKMVVVRLVNDDGTLGSWGLLELDEYEDDLRDLGR